MQTFPRTTASLAGAAIAGLLFATGASAETSPKMKMTTPMPESITTPARIESRLGTLEFPQGYPTDNTAEKLYEYLNFMHGVEAFLYTVPGASVHALGRGIKSQGGDNQTVLIFEQLMDSRSLFLTANTESIYNAMWLDLKDGPLVIESPSTSPLVRPSSCRRKALFHVRHITSAISLLPLVAGHSLRCTPVAVVRWHVARERPLLAQTV
jgi:hypothetical protein